MNKAVAIIIGLCMVCATQKALGAPMTDVPVPRHITRFYSDWNFAACFSTPAERSRLRLVDDLDKEEGLSQRLTTVGKHLNRVETRIQKIDPGIIMNRGVSYTVTPAFAEPISTVKEGNTISIRVRVWPLSPVDNAVLVSFYEKSQQKTPAPDIHRVKRLSRQAPRTEIHTWTRVNGQWMRNEVNLVLIQN